VGKQLGRPGAQQWERGKNSARTPRKQEGMGEKRKEIPVTGKEKGPKRQTREKAQGLA